MFMFLSHPLDPEGYAWPGEPVVSTRQCTDVSDDCPFCSFVSELPNHCGTHMDAPRHFVKDGLDINQLSIDYFCHTEVALLDIPKGPAEGIHKEDLEPFADTLAKVSFVMLRTGMEQYRDTDQNLYQNEGAYIAPDAGDYLTENFPNLKGCKCQYKNAQKVEYKNVHFSKIYSSAWASIKARFSFKRYDGPLMEIT